MDQLTWLFLGSLAVATTAATLFTDVEDIVGGMLGTLLWSLWALGATNVELVRATDTGLVTQTQTYPALALVGGGLAALSVLILLAGSTTLLDPRGADLIDPPDRGRGPGPP